MTGKLLRFHALLMAALGLALASGAGAAEARPHPLDPPSREEIGAAGRAIRTDGKFPPDGQLAEMWLQEPPKPAFLEWERSGAPLAREIFVVLYSRKADATWEVVVDVSRLDAPRIVSWTAVPGVQPVALDDEDQRLAAVVGGNPDWVSALHKRGLDPRDVAVNLWSVGHSDDPKPRRLRAVPYLRGDGANYFDRPIEGLEALVDMAGRDPQVRVMDSGHGEPVPPEKWEFDQESLRRKVGLREELKPLEIRQPQGPEFKVEGQEVSWQGWRFRWQMHPRSGLIVQRVLFEDKGEDGEPRTRSVLYRGSLSEMAVPYGDPKQSWAWRCAFDVGEYDVGRLAMPLQPGVDVPGNARLFDALFATNDGRPRLWRNVVAIYERDGGLLWKHGEDGRRARELVLFSISTVGNYDYGISWIFKQDGTVEVEATLTGVMLAKAVNGGPHDPYSHLVAPGVAAVHHQHVLSFRMDVDVDGPVNSVYSMNSESQDPGPDYYNTFVMREKVFESELGARENMSMATARTWRIGNPKAFNPLGHEASYILVPGANSLPLLDEKAPNRTRGGFMDYHLWVTRYSPRELYAAGDYPNQSSGMKGKEKGLPEWIKADRKVKEADVVLWYTMNVTHVPRPEEWPVMNVSRYSFKLVPAGFFVRNPTLDVPVSGR